MFIKCSRFLPFQNIDMPADRNIFIADIWASRLLCCRIASVSHCDPPPYHFQIFFLVHFCGYSGFEIAARLIIYPEENGSWGRRYNVCQSCPCWKTFPAAKATINWHFNLFDSIYAPGGATIYLFPPYINIFCTMPPICGYVNQPPSTSSYLLKVRRLTRVYVEYIYIIKIFFATSSRLRVAAKSGRYIMHGSSPN